ncbi:MAG: HsdM family class I SAM-dependent methyltransferase [Candidatus Anammoxibacter sp.]
MSILKKALTKINLTSENGLVHCNNPDEAKHIGERYHILEKAIKLEATAVLFRRKYDGDNITDSKPVLYIYSGNDELCINSEKHKELHAKIWSAGDIDVYFIVSKTTIDIFNARKPAEVQENTQELNLKNLCLVSEALKEFDDRRFSAMVFGKGVFWEQEDFFDDNVDKRFFKNRLKEENTPFHQLLEYLMAVREHLQANPTGLSPKTIDKLLIVCILVKFLEEIKDYKGKHTLRIIYKKYKVKSFAEALEKRICISILKELASEFNGDIFDKFSDKEKQQIKKTNLNSVADFLGAKLDIPTGQGFLWKQYNFNHLPVELISSIYENFLPKEKGVVYTPPFLVNALIDEVMPLDKAETYFSRNQFKVLDPSCGSGVFLVAAYKRILQWWSVNHYTKTREIKLPNKKICQQILENNIFGVDIKGTATLISVFSLAIALLDKLEPKEIWNNLKLNSLRGNIQTRNFFEWAGENKDKHNNFDLVIGNPPFNPKSGTSKQEAVSEKQIQVFRIRNKDIPNNNFALKFFEGAMFFGKKTCMVLPSNVLLYNKAKSAQNYRNRIFTKFTVEKIFDFTHLREILFVKKSPKHAGNKKKTGRTPVCAVFANYTESQGQNIEHTVVKRITAIEKKIAFEIDHYDRHSVPHNWATDEKKQFVWKTNLLGGGRLFHLIYRLSLLPKLNGFIDLKNDWKEIRGFEGGAKLVAESQDKIIGITENGEPEIERDIDIHSDNLKDIFMYTPPFMIIDQVLGENSLPACFIPKNSNFTQKKYLYYNRDFVGISVPQRDENTLKDIFNFIRPKKTNNQLNFQLYVLAVSSSSLVLTETDVNKSEILSVPYFPENEGYLELSETEGILQKDVLEYYIHLGKAISERGQGRKLHEKVSQVQLKQFGKTFCKVLNPIYAKNDKSWQCGKFSQTQSFTIYQFGYGKNKGLSFQMFDEEELDDIIKSLIYNNASNRGIIFTRVCRIYKHLNGYDCVFLIKPHAIRYWLNSIALHDADETFMDLKKAGR